MSNQTPVLTKKDIRKAAMRWIPMAVNTYTYQYQQAGSIVYSLSPALRKIYADNDDHYVASLNNHYNYFNTHPWLATLILGAALGIEDNGGVDSLEAVQSFKVGMMGPVAGIGDTLIWVLYPTIIGSIAGYMALEGSAIGAIAWLILNILCIFLRVKMFEWGYESGSKLITTLGAKLSQFTEAMSVMGLIVAGALIPSVVKVSTPLTFTAGEVTKEIQSVFDAILPFMLPVLCTFIAYKLIRSGKVKVTALILIIVVFSMVCAAFGLLA